MAEMAPATMILHKIIDSNMIRRRGSHQAGLPGLQARSGRSTVPAAQGKRGGAGDRQKIRPYARMAASVRRIESLR
jgi:hypothetical protein